MLVNIGYGSAQFRAVYKDQRLIGRPCFNLPKRETLILKCAEREGWARDLSAKITAKAESLVSKQEVSNETNVSGRCGSSALFAMLVTEIRAGRCDAYA